MRYKTGDTFFAFNNHAEYEAKILSYSKKNLVIECESLIRTATNNLKITLAFAPVKNPNTAFYVQKATELGATDLLPLITERTIVRTVKRDKLRLISVEATEQSEQFQPPIVHDALTLDKFLSTTASYNRIIFCDEARDSKRLAEALTSQQYNDLIMIGPEGGFSSTERELIKALPNAVSVKLCDTVLRAETAMILGLGAYKML